MKRIEYEEIQKIGEGIKLYRELKKISICTLSKESGVCKSTISDIENGIGNPTFRTVVKISRGLGLPIPVLVAWAEI